MQQNADQTRQIPQDRINPEARRQPQQAQRPQPQQQPVRKQPIPIVQEQPEQYRDEDLMDYEEDYERPQHGNERPIIQGYTLDQVNILRCVETIHMILAEADMSPLRVTRLTDAMLYLLVLGEMPELLKDYVVIPEAPPQPVSQPPRVAVPDPVQQQPQQAPRQPQEPISDIPEIEPDFPPMMESDLDSISRKLDGIDQGVMENVPEEKPKSAIGNILAKISGGGKDKKPEQTVKAEHRPESMG